MGQSKAQKEYNRQMAANAQDQYKLQREMFDWAKQGTPEQQKFRRDSAAWDTFIRGRNYGAPPPDSILNFDLWSPSQQNSIRERMAGLTGVGAAAMSGTGDQSIAVAQQRERNANLAAQDHANAYENAIKQQDAYYKGQGLAWSGQDLANRQSLLGNATSSAQFFFDQQRQTLPPSFMQTWGGLIGSALQAGSTMLAPGLGAGGMFNRRS